MPATIRIGTQGWNYGDWVGPFFPERTRSADFLSVYARAFDTVEVDSTFYAVPTSAALKSWYDRTPEQFIFALKFPRAVSHEERLRDVTGTTELFFDRVRELRHKLGPILVQMGPDFGPEELPALVDFLPRLPRDLNVAIEFRQRGWASAGVLALLREYNIALALVDGPWMPRNWVLKLAQRPAADFAYIRWIGPHRNLVDHSRIQVDRSRELQQWRGALDGLAQQVGTIYGYVSNYFAGHAPASARDVQALLDLPSVHPDLIGEQIRLF